jgi:uncharacterized membrane protein
MRARPPAKTHQLVLSFLDMMFGIHYIGVHSTEEKPMPFREKSAWLSLIAMALSFGPYFALVANSAAQDSTMPNLRLLQWFAATVVVQVIIMAAGAAILALVSPQEARTPPDERDHAIARRSVSAAYYVLIVGMIVVGCVMPFYASGWRIINAALLMIVAAELVHYGVTVMFYRRQA